MYRMVNSIIDKLLSEGRIAYADPVDDGETYYLGINNFHPVELLLDTSENDVWYIEGETAPWSFNRKNKTKNETLAHIIANEANQLIVCSATASTNNDNWEVIIYGCDDKYDYISECEFRFVGKVFPKKVSMTEDTIYNMIKSSIDSFEKTLPKLQRFVNCNSLTKSMICFQIKCHLSD